ncbi:conjugal transfer protein TraG [Lachnospiraceae bacterium 50-23]
MKYLVLFVKIITVFDLCCLAVYFGGDIVSSLIRKLKKKKPPTDSFEFYEDSGDAPLSIDSIRQLYSSDVETFVEERLLPDAAKTMEALTEREQTAARLLLCALIGYLKEEARMDEQSFPMVMELLKYMEGEKEEGCQDPVDWLLEDANSRAHRHESYYNDYQRYQLMQVDKKRVILACRILINDLVGKLYQYDYRFGYDLLLDEENSIEKKLHTPVREEWEDEDYET